MNRARSSPLNSAAVHLVLILYTALCIGPVLLVAVNSFKTRATIFGAPLSLPGPSSFDLIGYKTVLGQGVFLNYFANSLIVTVGSLAAVLLFGAMAAFALSEYRFRGNSLLGLFLALGIMVPIRLGTVAILNMMVAAHLVNTHLALILIYTAQGLPVAVFTMIPIWNDLWFPLIVAPGVPAAARCERRSYIPTSHRCAPRPSGPWTRPA
jgi:raffinose/stachyose/melibiose transport system permease protein